MAASALPLFSANSAAAEEAKHTKDGSVVVVKKKADPSAAPTWTWAIVAEPADLVNRVYPAFEVQHVIGTTARRPHSISFAYWGTRNPSSPTGSGGGYYSADKADPNVHTVDKYALNGYAIRYKLYPSRSTFFNIGLGLLTTRTQEAVEDSASGAQFSLDKSATSLGLDIGVGNRWVLPYGITIGATWVDTYLPFAVLAHHDAKIPDGYTTSAFAGGAKNDGERFAWRFVTIDAGYSF